MPEAAVMSAALLLAWAVDARFGEPRNAWHPVAWLGRLLAAIGPRLRCLPPRQALVAGAFAWLVIAAGLGIAAWGWQRFMLRLPAVAGVIGLALALKPSFAWRLLHDEVGAVEHALAIDLAGARRRLAMLVSRDVTAFDADMLRETAIETLAENLNDSLLAPLFWYALAGLPGALVYRFANTADAMWGYRGEWEWAGKFSARADDVLSWLPARLTAGLLWPPGRRRLRAEARKTGSPNGGWPMGAMALRLGVRLRKPGVYALNPQAPSPGAAQTALALRCATQAAWSALGLAVLCWLVRI